MPPEASLFSEFYDALISQGGVIALCLFILWAGHRRHWVWGRDYEDMRSERDNWRTLALEAIGVAHAGADAATTVAAELQKKAAPRRPPRWWILGKG